MCGIAGVVHFDSEKKVEYEVIKKMTDTLFHRGPDGEGFYLNNNIALGHRRLSIIDLKTGDQPMYNEDKSIILIFNGEIYNYIELQEELKKLGHSFRTHSDTETIIKAYQQWGIDCQNKFNGMWAFALWDDHKKQLFISRDRIGEKPLYYSVVDNTLIFGSEIKSILAYGIPKIPDYELLEIYLVLGFIPAPYTFFKNIKKLKAGCFLINKENNIVENKYWDLPHIDEGNMLDNKKEIEDHFKYLFNAAVKLQMRSDVPYGAFLSGGLDSSSVVGFMSEISSFPINTFTIGFNDKIFDERKLAHLVAEKYHTAHLEHIIEPDAFDEALNKVIHHYDEPFGDSSAIPTGYVSKFASEKVKMVLTGDGGDEVLSGYTIYQGEKFATYYQKLPRWTRKSFPEFISLISRPFQGSFRYQLNRVREVCLSSNLDFNSRYLSKCAFTDMELIKDLVKDQKVFPIEDYLKDFMADCSYKDSFYKLMFLNLKLTLPDDMLAKVDRMSMAYSLETRAPFLDYRLIEYMSHVHKDLKMAGFERKSILRNSIGKRLPEPLLKARKKGFGVPVREWFKDDSFNQKIESLTTSLSFLNKDAISKVVLSNKKGQKDNGNFIWMLFVLDRAINNTSFQQQ